MHRIARSVVYTFLLIMVGFAPVSMARAQDGVVSAEDSQAIQAVISAQIEAFRRDDGEAAFAFAAPLIRQLFGDVATFMGMVREAYQAVYRPQKVTFGELIASESRLPVQRVFLVGPDGALVAAHYIMEKQAGGEWRIAGVHLISADAGAPT